MAVIAYLSPYLGGPALMSGHKTVSSLPTTSYAATEEGDTLQETIATSGEVSRTTPAEPDIAKVPNSDKPAAPGEAPDCAAVTVRLMESYDDQVRKEKSSLDETLSFLGTLTYSSKYVEDYNAKITALYNRQSQAAAAEQCSLPVKAPDLLPATYPL